MDAQAYLRSQGWRGDGHSLDHTGKGIKRPLLISKKVDVLGVGLNKHAAVSDQWWLRAFDEGLKNFGTGQDGALAAIQKHGVNHGGLYARFVKGEGVAGTFGESATTSGQSTPIFANISQPKGSKVGMASDRLVGDELVRVKRTYDAETANARVDMLQHPERVPASVRQGTGHKRKRSEQSTGKRVRREKKEKREKRGRREEEEEGEDEEDEEEEKKARKEKKRKRRKEKEIEIEKARQKETIRERRRRDRLESRAE